MAALSTTLPLDFLNSHLAVPIPAITVESTANHYKIIENSGAIDNFTGSFTYNTHGVSSGVVYEYDWQASSGGGYSVSGLNINWNTFSAFLSADNTFGLLTSVFSGDDTMLGSAGNDTFLGFDGNDWIAGNDGNDDVNGNQGNDTVYGGFGDDNVRGGKDQDYVDGQGGNDTVNGNIGNDSVHGGDGNDLVLGGQNDDILFGDAGNDTLSGDLGNDTLYGGAGADAFLFNVGAGNDVIMDFEKGVDKIYITSALAATVNNDFNAAVSYVGADTYLTSPSATIHILNAHIDSTDIVIV